MARRKTTTTSDGKVSTKVTSGELKRMTRRATNVKPSKLKLNMLDSGRVTRINYRGDIIKLTKGWTEFILLMLSYIYDCYPEKYMKALERGKICSQNFDVTRHPPAYNSYGNDTYEIPRCPYFLMTNMSPTALLKAIQGFPEALEIEDEDILLDIDPLDDVEVLGINTVDAVEIKSDIIPIVDLDASKLDTYNFSCGYIFEKKFKASSFDAVAFQMIKYLMKGSKTALDNAVKCSIEPVVGVTDSSDITALITQKISKNSMYVYHSNKVNIYTIKFILDLIEAEGLPQSALKIKVDKLGIS